VGGRSDVRTHSIQQHSTSAYVVSAGEHAVVPFRHRIGAEGTPKLQIVSCSWKSLVEQKRLDETYSAFVSELHRRIAVTAAPVRFEQGANPLVYWPGLSVFVAAALRLR
jgi:hypothetical protein